MSRSGKTLTVFIVVFFLLLLSLTSIVTFFLMKEREIRQSVEQKLAVSETTVRKLEADLKAAKEEIVVSKSKLKEQDDKISGLLDDLELEKGLRDEIKKENATLKAQVDAISAERKTFQDELITLRDKNTFLQDELSSAKELREQVAASLEEAQAKVKELEDKLVAATAVNLDKIVVSPEESAAETEPTSEAVPEAQSSDAPMMETSSNVGQILKVNVDNDFVIIDLGAVNGVTEGATVEFYRQEALLGEGTVTRVQNVMSVADLVAPLSANQLRVSDRVTIK